MPDYNAPIAQALSMAVHAAIQQKQLQQAQQEFTRHMAMQQQELGLRQQLEKTNLLNSGARPVDNSGNVTLPGSASPAFGDPMGVDSLPGAPAGTFAAEPGRTVSIGKSAFELPTLDERSQAQADRAAQRAREVYNATAVPISDQMADLVGVARGTKLPPNQIVGYGGLTGAVARATKPQAKAPALKYEDFRNNKTGEVTRLYSDRQGNVVKRVPLGNLVGAANAGGGRSGGGLTPDAAATNKARDYRTYSTLLSEENEGNALRRRLGAALHNNLYLDKNGNIKPLAKDRYGDARDPNEVEAMRADMQQRFVAATTALKSAINQKYDLMARMGVKPQVPREKALAAIDAGTAQVTGKASSDASQPPAAAAQIRIGQTATNPKTHKRVQWNGAAWVPIH